MPDKYSLAKCEQYGRRLAARLCDQHFGPSPTATLDGPAVLRFTPIRQLNLLVVHQLLQQWQAEIGRLRSPYFDFEAPAVQTALAQFQNVLSRYIRLSRPAFEPLLAQATADALRLAADPANAFAHLFLNQQSVPTPSQLRDALRYLDFNKGFFAAFLDLLPADQPLSYHALETQLSDYQAANYLADHQVMQNLIITLNNLLPLTEADLRENNSASVPTPIAPATSIALALTASDVTTSSNSTSPTSAADPSTPSIQISLGEGPTTTLVRTEPHLQQDSSATKLPLHEKLKATQPVGAPLAATLRAATTSTSSPLAERNTPKVETLREAISINQRFGFINELFAGDDTAYQAAIQHLDSLPDQEQARLYIMQHLAPRYNWQRKEEHIVKLLKLIERRYNSA